MNDYKELVESLRGGYPVNFDDDGFTMMHIPSDYEKQAADAIEQLVGYAAKCEKECEDAEKYIEQLVRERDAAVEDLRLTTHPCMVCKHFSEENCGCDAFYECAVEENDLWEWRGVQE